MNTHTYHVREIFHSLQGEGARAGSVNVFLRFAHCNLQCTVEKEGFNCDTDFHVGKTMTAEEIVEQIRLVDETPSGCGSVIITGGEPTLQFDQPLAYALARAGYSSFLETNGTRVPKADPHYIAVSPKPGHPCLLPLADECRVVLKAGQVPDEHQMRMADRTCKEGRWFISPSFYAPEAEEIRQWNARDHQLGELYQAEAVEWCIEFCKQHPDWRLSLQMHKIIGVR